LTSLASSTVSVKRRIIDAHHHFWDLSQNYHPWLCDAEPIPFRYGNYQALRRNFLQADYLQLALRYEVQGSVYVETEWDPQDTEGEMRYVQSLKASQSLPTVAVAHVRLDHPAVEQKLRFQKNFDFVRSVRHKPLAHAKPGQASPGGMMDAQWRRGFQVLQALGLRFDLQTPWWHMHEACDLAKAFPDTTIIINHAGLPADRSPEGLAAWQAAMRQVSVCPNVFVKISGIGVPGQAWTVAANQAIVLSLLNTFGVARCMFASNFPVDSLCGSWNDIWGGFEEMVKDFSASEQDALFRSNANRIYAMGLPND
jgi:predicted TIM-barrel fold metal-dependent hydrolase